MEDIRENGKVLTDSIKHVHHSGIKGKLFPANSIIFATTATIGEHALIQVPFMCNQQLTHIHLKEEYTNIINVKYLFYYADLIDDMCKKNTKGGSTLPAVALEKFKMFKIPVPPLEVQCEIVRILDSFTLLTAELTAELTARKKQYEYYRDTLLVNPNTDVTKNVLLSEVAKIKNGKDYKHLSEGVIPVYGSGGIMTYVNQYCYDKPSVLIPRKGSLSNLFYVDEPFWNVDTIFYTEIDEEKVIPKYLYYLLQKQHLEDLNTAGGVPSLTQAVLNKVSLLLPSIDKQLKIVECLDNFDAICSDLNIGLPAEIEARQKQYEFYRDQLLTFAETGRTILTDRQTDRQSLIKLLQYVFGYAPVKLRDIATIVRGGNFQKKDFVENGRPCIHYGQMYTHFGIAADKTLTFVNNEVFSKSKIAKPGDIVMAVTSENVEDVCSCTAWIGAEEIAISGHTAIISHKQNPKFLSYYFHSEMFFMQKKKLAHGTKVIEVTPSKLGDIEILLPNMEEQNRIVSILDRFDSLCNSISEGLPAEIEARQKQYEYYRDKLLNFNQS
jgi:type I restriction enzyme S subunit